MRTLQAGTAGAKVVRYGSRDLAGNLEIMRQFRNWMYEKGLLGSALPLLSANTYWYFLTSSLILFYQ
jgi:hypothetical protein